VGRWNEYQLSGWVIIIINGDSGCKLGQPVQVDSQPKPKLSGLVLGRRLFGAVLYLKNIAKDTKLDSTLPNTTVLCCIFCSRQNRWQLPTTSNDSRRLSLMQWTQSTQLNSLKLPVKLSFTLWLLVCVSQTNWSARKQRLHPQSVAEISRHSALSEHRIRQCGISSGSRHKDTDQCLIVAISFCRHRSVPVPCENGPAETTVAEGGQNPVAGLWGGTLGENWPSEATSSYASIDFWCQLVASPATQLPGIKWPACGSNRDAQCNWAIVSHAPLPAPVSNRQLQWSNETAHLAII